MPLVVRNWTEFQHYKDRSPPWIKLHRGLLDDFRYHHLPPIAAKWLPLIWLLASEKGGEIPSAEITAFRLHILPQEAQEAIDALEKAAFLIEGEASDMRAKALGWGTRYISDAVKAAVSDRDGGKCCGCESTENIEYDHITPVSKGGSSLEDNVQLLCRKCNRTKRTKIATPKLRLAEPRGREEAENRETPSGFPLKDRPTPVAAREPLGAPHDTTTVLSALGAMKRA